MCLPGERDSSKSVYSLIFAASGVSQWGKGLRHTGHWAWLHVLDLPAASAATHARHFCITCLRDVLHRPQSCCPHPVHMVATAVRDQPPLSPRNASDTCTLVSSACA